MTDHRISAFSRMAPMNVTVTPAGRSCFGSEISSEDVQQRLSKSQATGLVPNEWSEDIPAPQHRTDRETHLFFTFSDVNSAGDFSCAPEGCAFFFNSSFENHPFECFN